MVYFTLIVIIFTNFSLPGEENALLQKLYLKRTLDVIMLHLFPFFLTFCGYLNYNLCFQRLYIYSTFLEVFHSHGFSSREITWLNEAMIFFICASCSANGFQSARNSSSFCGDEVEDGMSEQGPFGL